MKADQLIEACYYLSPSFNILSISCQCAYTIWRDQELMLTLAHQDFPKEYCECRFADQAFTKNRNIFMGSNHMIAWYICMLTKFLEAASMKTVMKSCSGAARKIHANHNRRLIDVSMGIAQRSNGSRLHHHGQREIHRIFEPSRGERPKNVAVCYLDVASRHVSILLLLGDLQNKQSDRQCTYHEDVAASTVFDEGGLDPSNLVDELIKTLLDLVRWSMETKCQCQSVDFRMTNNKRLDKMTEVLSNSIRRPQNQEINSLSPLTPISPNIPRPLHIQPLLLPSRSHIPWRQPLIIAIIPFRNLLRHSQFTWLCECWFLLRAKQDFQRLCGTLTRATEDMCELGRVYVFIATYNKVCCCLDLLDTVGGQSDVGFAGVLTGERPFCLACGEIIR